MTGDRRLVAEVPSGEGECGVVPRVEHLHGVDLPAGAAVRGQGGGRYEDVHVGLKQGTTAVDLCPGDVPAAKWTMGRRISRVESGRDFGGPFVSEHGDDRHLGLRWYGREPDGHVENFRALKLRFAEVDPALIDQALRTGHSPHQASYSPMSRAGPRCARVPPTRDHVVDRRRLTGR